MNIYLIYPLHALLKEILEVVSDVLKRRDLIIVIDVLRASTSITAGVKIRPSKVVTKFTHMSPPGGIIPIEELQSVPHGLETLYTMVTMNLEARGKL
jgi:hypothetical protein